jgi:acyl-CoA thioesterase-1
MLKSFISAFLLLLLSISSAEAEHSGPGPILVVGDSLSAEYGISRDSGWVALLKARLQDRAAPHDVINASISGDTTRSGSSRLPRALARHQPAVVLIQLGGNDGLRGLPLEESERNLRAMISLSRDAGARVLLAGVRLPPNYGREYTEAFESMYRDVADDTGIALVPRLLDGIDDRPELMQADGIHPRAEAQARILENLWPTLESLLGSADQGSSPQSISNHPGNSSSDRIAVSAPAASTCRPSRSSSTA